MKNEGKEGKKVNDKKSCLDFYITFLWKKGTNKWN